jgi:cytochrome c-type biogenesis protein
MEKAGLLFLAGFASIAFPCVLPLVPGYLSAVSAIEVEHLGERGAGRRVVAASIPFIGGFTVVFVLLGAAAAAVASTVDKTTQTTIAGFILVVLGLAFCGLLPWPEQTVAPGVAHRARRTGSAVLLGGAFAIVAAPCIGTVLASILVLASVAFAHAMQAFRWIRRHYQALRIVSGATLIALGLLLFFNRDWWLRIALDQFFQKLGLHSS